jgi:hypothetical protein
MKKARNVFLTRESGEKNFRAGSERRGRGNLMTLGF